MILTSTTTGLGKSLVFTLNAIKVDFNVGFANTYVTNLYFNVGVVLFFAIPFYISFFVFN